jgi:DeoR/GlpR family transcriptional regulator of sugar metabolism
MTLEPTAICALRCASEEARGVRMRTGQRRREILQRLLNDGHVRASDLSDRFGVNRSTIRRDLEALAQDGYLHRTHGGARLVSGAVDIPYTRKLTEHLEEKRAVAREAYTLVRAGDAVILDSGSTTYELAVLLRTVPDLTVVTNDVRIARVVADFPMARLLVTGGEQLSSTYTLVGDRAVQCIEQMRVDTTFLGADAVTAADGVTNTNAIEVPLKRAMIRAGHRVVALADSSKFDRVALMRVCSLDELDLLITVEGVDELEGGADSQVRRAPMVETHREETGAP